MLRYTRTEFKKVCATGERQVIKWHSLDNPVKRDGCNRIYYTEQDVRDFLNLPVEAVLTALPKSKFATLNSLSQTIGDGN